MGVGCQGGGSSATPTVELWKVLEYRPGLRAHFVAVSECA